MKNELTLKEAKTLLQISDLSKDDYIQAMIPIVTEYVVDYCQNPELEVTGGVKIAIAKIIEFYMNNTSLQSQSLSRIDQTFLTEIPQSILNLLAPYSNRDRIKFL